MSEGSDVAGSLCPAVAAKNFIRPSRPVDVVSIDCIQERRVSQKQPWVGYSEHLCFVQDQQAFLNIDLTQDRAIRPLRFRHLRCLDQSPCQRTGAE